MQGRLENKFKTEKVIERILKELPQSVKDYYYNISISSEIRSCESYVRIINDFFCTISDNPKRVNVKNIKETDITMYLHDKEVKGEEDSDIKQTSFSYRKLIHSGLKSYFDYLYNTSKIAINPMAAVPRPKQRDEVKREYLSSDDLRLIMEVVRKGASTQRESYRSSPLRTTRDTAIMMLLISTGMRKTALTEINVEDIDFENKTVTITDKISKVHVYTISEPVEQVLKQWLRIREEYLAEHHRKSDALFISRKLERISPQRVTEFVGVYTQDALGKPLSPHKLRSAYCTRLYEVTHDIEFVREAVGHSSVATTQRYIRKNENIKQKASEIMVDTIV